VHFPIAQDLDSNVSNWAVGTVHCAELSVVMQGFGGFPSHIFVREEMKKAWSVIVPGIIERKQTWAFVGSPGVGKSILIVLICCHLAKDINRSVFLARNLKGVEDGNPNGEVALFMYPGGKQWDTVALSTSEKSIHQIMTIITNLVGLLYLTAGLRLN
jgi:hypothetical protein